MRLAAFKKHKELKKKPEFKELFILCEHSVTCLIKLLTVATNNNELVWDYSGLNMYTAAYQDLKLSFDQPNNEPAYLYFGTEKSVTHVQDNGSGSYGFKELADAINSQHQLEDFRTKYSEIIKRTHPFKHPHRTRLIPKTR